MVKKLVGFRLDEKIVLDISKLEKTKKFNNKTHVVETALVKGLKILKRNTYSKY